MFFENTNTIHTSRASWKLTLIQDVSDFPQAINRVGDQVNELLVEVRAHMPRNQGRTRTKKTTSLQIISIEVKQLLSDLNTLKENGWRIISVRRVDHETEKEKKFTSVYRTSSIVSVWDCIRR